MLIIKIFASEIAGPNIIANGITEIKSKDKFSKKILFLKVFFMKDSIVKF